MSEIIELTKIDFKSVFIAVVVILIGVKAIVSLFEWIVDKLGLETKWVRNKKAEHELLLETSKKQDNLSDCMNNIINSVGVLQQKQDEIVTTVNKLVDSNQARDEATIEEMCDRIGQKTRYYINVLHGIPEDEYDDFVRLFNAYEGIGGNHGAKQKYEYCIKHLEVLPVKKEIIVESK